MKTYTNFYSTATSPLCDIARIINNSAADNLTWGLEMVNDSIRYLVTKFYFNERSYTTTTVAGTQFYNLPPQVKKLINVTVTIGSVLWQPKECPNRSYWDSLNVISFQQDFPSYFFVFNGQVGIFPKPATTGNTITMNYKTRLIDLSMADVTSGTVSVTTNTTTITHSATAFLKWMAQQGWIRIAHSSTDSANGDNQWYEISSVTDTSHLELKNKYTGATVTAGSYIIGEVPLLPEDYQDLPLYRMGYLYYTTRFPDPIKADLYKRLYDEGFEKLNEEFGSKTTNVVLTDTDAPIYNPNLYQSNLSQI